MTSDEMLRSYVSRIEKLESEIADLNSDKADIYAEAKGNGFDVPALKAFMGERRKAAKDPIKFEEFSNWLDTYRNTMAAGTERALTRAPARARAKPAPCDHHWILTGRHELTCATCSLVRSNITETDRAVTTSGAPGEGPDRAKPASPDPIPKSSAVAAPVASPLPLADAGAPPTAALDTPPSPAGVEPLLADTSGCPAARKPSPVGGVPAGEPDDWQQRDAAGNYTVALGAIRERHVASGAARLQTTAELVAALDPPAFLDRRRA